MSSEIVTLTLNKSFISKCIPDLLHTMQSDPRYKRLVREKARKSVEDNSFRLSRADIQEIASKIVGTQVPPQVLSVRPSVCVLGDAHYLQKISNDTLKLGRLLQVAGSSRRRVARMNLQA
jgi:hypothetical protein